MVKWIKIVLTNLFIWYFPRNSETGPFSYYPCSPEATDITLISFLFPSHHAATFKLPRGDKLRRHSMVREIRASSSEQRLLTKWNLDTARRRWLLTSRPQSETKNSQVSRNVIAWDPIVVGFHACRSKFFFFFFLFTILDPSCKKVIAMKEWRAPPNIRFWRSVGKIDTYFRIHTLDSDLDECSFSLAKLRDYYSRVTLFRI